MFVRGSLEHVSQPGMWAVWQDLSIILLQNTFISITVWEIAAALTNLARQKVPSPKITWAEIFGEMPNTASLDPFL